MLEHGSRVTCSFSGACCWGGECGRTDILTPAGPCPAWFCVGRWGCRGSWCICQQHLSLSLPPGLWLCSQPQGPPDPCNGAQVWASDYRVPFSEESFLLMSFAAGGSSLSFSNRKPWLAIPAAIACPAAVWLP